MLPVLLLSGFGGICLVGKGLWEVFLLVTGWHTQIFAESVSALYLSVGCGRSVHERDQSITRSRWLSGRLDLKGNGRAMITNCCGEALRGFSAVDFVEFLGRKALY